MEKRGAEGSGPAVALPRYSFAFQPIVDAPRAAVVGYEALVRGTNGEPARSILAAVPEAGVYRFDQEARIAAIRLATALRFDGRLHVNLLPRGLHASEAAVQSTLAAAHCCGIALERIVLEVTESELVENPAAFVRTVNAYRGVGLTLAIDDFGAGYSGLNLLADFQPDELKLDIHLVRAVARSGPRQAIVRAVAQACTDLGIDLIAEGVENVDDYIWLREEGIRLFQGFLFAPPGFQRLPEARFPFVEP